MSLQDAIEIQRREAALRPNLRQKLGTIAPLLFGTFLACGLAASLFRERPAGYAGEPSSEIAALFVLGLIVILFWQEQRHRRQIARLEIELLKLRRQQSEARER